MIVTGTWSRKNRFNVQWQLGNFCNYKCSYCPTRLRDGRFEFVTIDLAKRVVDNILRQKPDHNVLFSFQGGEVTLWKEFENLLKYIYEQGASSLLATNGSRTPAYFAKIAPYLNYTFMSFHEVSEVDKMLERIKVFHPQHVASYTLMNLNLWDKCVDAHERIEAAGYRSIARVIFDDYCTLNTQQLSYTSEQRQYIDKCNLHLLKPARLSDPLDHEVVLPLPVKMKGVINNKFDPRIIQIHDAGTVINTTAQSLLATQQNDYSGFNCYAGLEVLCIGASGGVTTSVCAQDGIFADIFDNPEFELPTVPMSCNRTSCWCESDLQATKISPGEPTFNPNVQPAIDPVFDTAKSLARDSLIAAEDDAEQAAAEEDLLVEP